jgi:Zn-dependent protease
MDIENIIRQAIVSILPIIFAITFHEVAHGWTALKLGDRTAQALGRLTLNPIKHIDPVGTILMPLMLYVLTNGQFVFGYAKPVPIDPRNFKDPRRGMAISAAAGPGMNIILAILSGILLKFTFSMSGVISPSIGEPLMLMMRSSMQINIILASLNLIPIPPLDGSRIVAAFLPRDLANKYDGLERYGMIIVLILIMTGMARLFIQPIANLIYSIIRLIIGG